MIEQLKKLAEYCGYEIQGNIDNDLFLFTKHDKMYCFKWNPSENWNQLMEVVKRINDCGCIVEMSLSTAGFCRIVKINGKYAPCTITQIEDLELIQATYQAVYEFVKQNGGK